MLQFNMAVVRWLAAFDAASPPTLSPHPQTALCQQFRKEVHIRNLPSLFKKPKADKDLLSGEQLGLEALFGPDSRK